MEDIFSHHKSKNLWAFVFVNCAQPLLPLNDTFIWSYPKLDLASSINVYLTPKSQAKQPNNNNAGTSSGPKTKKIKKKRQWIQKKLSALESPYVFVFLKDHVDLIVPLVHAILEEGIPALNQQIHECIIIDPYFCTRAMLMYNQRGLHYINSMQEWEQFCHEKSSMRQCIPKWLSLYNQDNKSRHLFCQYPYQWARLHKLDNNYNLSGRLSRTRLGFIFVTDLTLIPRLLGWPNSLDWSSVIRFPSNNCTTHYNFSNDAHSYYLYLERTCEYVMSVASLKTLSAVTHQLLCSDYLLKCHSIFIVSNTGILERNNLTRRNMLWLSYYHRFDEFHFINLSQHASKQRFSNNLKCSARFRRVLSDAMEQMLPKNIDGLVA
ncbi:MAG: hypothetical protein KGL95_05220 [Patescibacteria group bacterium]|nr:hypothetical protein [Patescibacteria group bacterium]